MFHRYTNIIFIRSKRIFDQKKINNYSILFLLLPYKISQRILELLHFSREEILSLQDNTKLIIDIKKKQERCTRKHNLPFLIFDLKKILWERLNTLQALELLHPWSGIHIHMLSPRTSLLWNIEIKFIQQQKYNFF